MDFLTFFDNDFKAVMPELYLFCAILVLLSYGVIYSTSKTFNYPMIQLNVGWLTVLSILISFFLLINCSLTTTSVFNAQLIIDPFSTFAKGLILLSSALSSYVNALFRI
jgi:hypothetical protein